MIAVITFGRPVVSQTINKEERKKNSVHVDLEFFGKHSTTWIIYWINWILYDFLICEMSFLDISY